MNDIEKLTSKLAKAPWWLAKAPWCSNDMSVPDVMWEKKNVWRPVYLSSGEWLPINKSYYQESIYCDWLGYWKIKRKLSEEDYMIEQLKGTI